MTQLAFKIRGEKITKITKLVINKVGKWYLGHPETIYEFRSISVTSCSWDSFLS